MTLPATIAGDNSDGRAFVSCYPYDALRNRFECRLPCNANAKPVIIVSSSTANWTQL